MFVGTLYEVALTLLTIPLLLLARKPYCKKIDTIPLLQL